MIIDICTQKPEMKGWFLITYADPADFVPFDCKEGGYLYQGDGPHDAFKVLTEKFRGKCAEVLIRE